MYAVTTVKVPDHFPILPVIPVPRNPLFPHFVRLIDVSDPDLIAILRAKIRMGIPYVGIFLKRNDE